MSSTVQSVERAFAILEAFDDLRPARSAADIATTTGLTRPTTYRMLKTLEELGYVHHRDGRFGVTPRVLRLGAGYLGRGSIAAVAQPVLDQLSDEVGEHVAIGALDGDEVVTLAASSSNRSRFLAVAVEVGQRLPAASTSLGRILLAHRPGADDASHAAIRAAGHVVSDGLIEAGLRSIGVAVVDQSGTAVASISIAVNASRVSVDELVATCLPPLRAAAARIGEQL